MQDSATIMAMILSVIAGFSTIIGALVVLFMGKNRSTKLLSMALGLASGVMLSASFTDMLPEATEYFENVCGNSGAIALGVAFMVLGIIIAFVLDRAIPHSCACHDESGEGCENDVSRLGLVSTIAIGFHNFPEGIALFFAGYTDVSLGVALTIAIVLHNIPGGITIAAPVYYATGSKSKALLYTLIPSLIQPLGALLACVVLRYILGDFAMGAMFGIVSGFLLFIALVELYPNSRKYGNTNYSTFALFVGAILMQLTGIIE